MAIQKPKYTPDMKELHELAAQAGGVFTLDITRKRDGVEEVITTRTDVRPEHVPTIYSWLRNEWSGGGHYFFRAYDPSGSGKSVTWDRAIPGTPLTPADVSALERMRHAQGAVAAPAPIVAPPMQQQPPPQLPLGYSAMTQGGQPGFAPQGFPSAAPTQQFGAVPPSPYASQFPPPAPFSYQPPAQAPDSRVEALKDQINMLARERDKDRDTFTREMLARETAQREERLRQEFNSGQNALREQLAALTNGFQQAIQQVNQQNQQMLQQLTAQMQQQQQLALAAQNNNTPLLTMVQAMMQSQAQAQTEATRQVQAAAQAGIESSKETARLFAERMREKGQMDPMAQMLLQNTLSQMSPEAQRRWFETSQAMTSASMEMMMRAMQVVAEQSGGGENPWINVIMQGLQGLQSIGEKIAADKPPAAPQLPAPAPAQSQPLAGASNGAQSDLTEFGRIAPDVQALRDGVRSGWPPETAAMRIIQMSEKAQALDPEKRMVDRWVQNPLGAMKKLLPTLDLGYHRQVIAAIQAEVVRQSGEPKAKESGSEAESSDEEESEVSAN